MKQSDELKALFGPNGTAWRDLRDIVQAMPIVIFANAMRAAAGGARTALPPAPRARA